MREIKLRGWSGGKMCYYKLVPHGNGLWFQAEPDFRSMGALSIMQFTGRKDKDGNEIWEGDIVKWDMYFFDFSKPENEEKVNKTLVSSIVWKEHGFWVEAEGFGWEGEGLWKWDEMEVIGNIYEHSELLKDAESGGQ